MFLANKLNKGAGSPAALDAQFNYVTMLLHGDGTNGAQNNTFLDSSTNNFTITRNGNTTQGSFSPYGSNWSNYFAGATNYFSLSATPTQFGTGDFTVEGWINHSTTTTSTFVGLSPYDTGGWAFGVNFPSLGDLYFYDGTGLVMSYSGISANTWYHVAVARSGASIKMFVNGTQVASASASGKDFYASTSTLVGTDYSGQNFKGYISNIRVVKGTALYTSSFTPSTTPLTAISGTSLLTCQSNRFIDNSTNNYTITVTGTPSVQRFNPFGASTAYSTSVIGGSGYFDGTGDYLTIANNSAFYLTTNSFTVEAWVYLTAAATSGNNSFIFGNVLNSTGGGGYLFYIGSDLKPVLYYTTSGAYNPSGAYTSSTAMPLNAWTHLAFVRAGDNWNIYINGVSTAAVTQSNSVYSSSNNFTIGADLNGATQTFLTGYISNLRLVNGTAVYTTNFTPPTAPLTAITNTVLLTSYINGAIYDNVMMNDLETVGNAQISTSVVKYGTGSLAFDGAGDYLVSPYNPNQEFGSGNLTWEMWINTTNSVQYATLYSKTPASFASGMWTLMMNMASSTTGDVGVYMADYSTSTPLLQTTGVSVRDGAWHHIAVVRNGGSWVLYVDGTSKATRTWSGTIAVLSTSGSYIGKDQFYGRDYNGYIDDLRITKGYARYTANFTPPTAAFPNIGPV